MPLAPTSNAASIADASVRRVRLRETGNIAIRIPARTRKAGGAARPAPSHGQWGAGGAAPEGEAIRDVLADRLDLGGGREGPNLRHAEPSCGRSGDLGADLGGD